MASQITPNTFLTHCAGPSSSEANVTATTIFFISGNPGLISYYHPFLSLLADQLTVSEGSGGFELPEDKIQTSNDRNPKPSPKVYGLEDQIHFVHGKLHTLVTANSKTTLSQTRGADAAIATATAPPRQKVILIGHSVGAYIAMEILRRHRETAGSKSAEFDIIGGVMLFPTVMDIAASPSGQKLTTLLSFIPGLALVVGFFARLLTFLLPNQALRSLIRFVMNSPPDHALDATFTFLKSPTGVRQALDEMRTITTDKWTDDVWGAATARQPITKLFFYFGRNDHWVAEKTRDEIIALRGQTGGKGSTMLVCEEGLPHAFCLKHNDVMARKVAEMIRDIVARR
ncbi:hypothetical protein N7510_003183 [Penicillium lagena]|uniref:uncharacterized protein n=1 Tax=Penicillium lagena TaxID=94218 RepID=UPI002540550D|nr:uncharacterized protein N7510_003183 [Penicillium lagena]KAJ5619199.1 hypothetical protein N7510_003183 [Penicillium lagena]